MSVVAGINLGTQSTKVLVYDAAKKIVLATTSASYGVINTDNGGREQEAATWTDATIQCFGKIDPSIRKRIQAIGVSGQQHGFVPVDKDGKVIAAVKLWCDTSTKAECEELTSRLGGDKALLSAGLNTIKTGYTVPKILWLKKHNRDAWRRLAHVLLPHDYLNFWLTGEYVMEPGDASGTGLMHIPTRQWSPKVINAVDPALEGMLPKIVPSESVIGRVTAATASLLGIPAGVAVSGGGGDNMAAAIGCGVVSPGQMAASLGTSATLFGVSNTPVIDPKGDLAAFCSSSGSWLPLLCTMNCTVATELTRTLLGRSLEEFEANVKSRETKIGANGVLCLPFFQGERTPNYPNGSGCFVGLKPDTFTVPNLFRSTMEAAVFGLQFGLTRFTDLKFKADQIRAVGGGAKSDAWLQTLADVTGIPVVRPDVTEAGAFGAALQSLWALGKSKGGKTGIAEICREHIKIEGAPFQPDPKVYNAYRECYQAWIRYSEHLAPLFA